MRAFEIHINGKRACLAGIGGEGVLTAIVSWSSKHPPTDRLEVGGLHGVTRQHTDWGTFVLNVGDEVKIRVADVDESAVDSPTNIRQDDAKSKTATEGVGDRRRNDAT